jgi:hypothetical protein
MEFHQSEYHQWLINKKPKEIIGVTCASASCPIASWLSESLNHKVVVETDQITICYPGRKPNKTYEAPPWIYNYVEAVDAIGNREEITAARALALLDEVQS